MIVMITEPRRAPSYVDVRVADGVHHITLARPDRRNALGLELCQELSRALDAAEADAEAWAVVLSGAGSAFCVGADMKDYQLLVDGTWGPTELAAYEQAMPLRRVWELRLPLISVIAGPCVGGGVLIACSSDYVLATPAATFSMPEVRWGWSEPAMPTILPRLVGQRCATRMLMFAEKLDAAQAERVGLVDAVVAPEDIADSLDRFLLSQRELSATARKAYKQSLRASIGPVEFGSLAASLV
jgi:enoyl-CoA hydratase/carnithine racemase